MSLQLTIVTPGGEIFDEPVKTVVLPGSEGEFGVLERHERALSPLKPGAVRIAAEDGGADRYAAVSDGFADVSAKRVVLLVDRCQMAGDIDRAEVERERDAASNELASMTVSDGNEGRRAVLEGRLAIAEAWLDVAERA